MSSPSTQHQFQAETQKLLDIVINSLYSSKEIFLRELISNASDALDRLRFEALTHPDLIEQGEVLEIRLETDRETRTLSVIDNGIGMSRDEVVANLGTIAKSGTREVLEQAREAEDPTAIAQLIGQFGVGFYSAFMVADEVTVVTRRAGQEQATRWQSSGDGQYTIADDNRFLRGTTVTLRLKPEDLENGLPDFTDPSILAATVKKHSDFVAYPVRAKMPKPPSEIEAPERQEDERQSGARGQELVERTLNSMQPLWTKPESEVDEEELHEFYRHIAHDWNEPLLHMRLHAEGRVEYQALLFLPSHAPLDLFIRDQAWGLQLYVRRVLILDRCEDLLPPHLRFVKGVVDASDLSLNVSRELLQKDRRIAQMRNWLSRRVLDRLQKLLGDERQTYEKLWREFGRVLKEGVHPESGDRDRILPLLLFASSRQETGLTTLAEYVERMPEAQEEIFYLTAESMTVAQTSPHLEAFAARGIEVLLLADPIDEIMVSFLPEFEGHALKAIAQGEVELGSDEERKAARDALLDRQKEMAPLLQKLQSKLDKHVSQVRLSSRLTASPAVLVTAEGGISPHLERLLRQTEGEEALPAQRRILELNPDHPIVRGMEAAAASGEAKLALDDFAQLIFGYALLAEGSELPQPAEFNRVLVELMSSLLASPDAAPSEPE